MVTPALAAAWLAAQPPGRFNPGLPDPARVAQIAADIEADRFDTARGRPVAMRVTGEGLILLDDAAGAADALHVTRR
jgi:hypothetical protein